MTPMAAEERKLLSTVERALGYAFSDLGLLERALTHASYANEALRDPGVEDNETLEFLGDAILNLLVAEILLEAYPEAREGVLSKARSQLVSEGHFAAVARKLGLGEALRLAPAESREGGRRKDSLLADAFEAVVAAVYRDAGFEAARRVVRHLFEGDVAAIDLPSVPSRDPKTALQEAAQAGGKSLPVYRLLSESGPDHRKRFVFEVELEGGLRATGEGSTKKEAQQGAAGALLGLLAKSPA